MTGVGFTGTPSIDLYTDAASMYLIMANEIGLVGVGLFASTMIGVFAYGLRAWRAVQDNHELRSILLGYHAALLAALLNGTADLYFFRLDFQASITLFWLTVALALAVHGWRWNRPLPKRPLSCSMTPLNSPNVITFRSAPTHPRHSRANPGKGTTESSMKRAYELTFIVRLDGNDEAAVNGTIDQVRAWVETEELGQVMKIDRWGRRKLAYEIDNQREGYYILFDANIEPRAIEGNRAQPQPCAQHPALSFRPHRRVSWGTTTPPVFWN